MVFLGRKSFFCTFEEIWAITLGNNTSKILHNSDTGEAAMVVRKNMGIADTRLSKTRKDKNHRKINFRYREINCAAQLLSEHPK